MEKDTIIIQKNTTVLDALTEYGFSYNYACKMLRNKDVRLFDDKIKDNYPLTQGDQLTFFFTTDAKQTVNHQIVFEDDNVAIINKPAGIETEDLAKQLRLIAVHRLDRNTTGLVMFAKSNLSEQSLTQAIKNHCLEKKYLAEVVGKTEYKTFKHNAFLLKDSKQSLVKIFDKQVKGSQPITTIFNTISANPSSSVVECTLVTGKTHQIRASLSYLGHPIIGDGKYGKNEDNKKFKAKNQRLHSYSLKLKNLTTPLEYLNGQSFKVYPEWYRK